MLSIYKEKVYQASDLPLPPVIRRQRSVMLIHVKTINCLKIHIQHYLALNDMPGGKCRIRDTMMCMINNK